MGARHAHDADAVLAELEVANRTFQEIGSDGEHLRAQSFARTVNGRRQGHGAAARDGPEPDGDRRGVGKRHDHVGGIDAPGIGHDLRKNRLHALALGAGAGRHEDLARRIDPHHRALERTHAGSLDIAADAETEVTTLLPRRALALAKRRDTAERIERLPQRPRIIAAVVDDGFAVAIGHAHAIGHFVGPDHVAQAHFGGLEAELAGHEIDDPLHRKRGFRAPCSPIRRVRNLVGCGDPGIDRDSVDLVGTEEMHRGVVDHAGADRIPRAAIDDELVAQRQDAAFVVEAHLDVVHLVA